MMAGLIVWAVPRRLFAALGALSVAVLLFRPVAWRYGLTDRVAGFFFDGSWLMFAAGILVYYQLNYRTLRTTVMARLALGAGMASALRQPAAVEYMRLTAFGFALLLSLVRPWDERIAAISILRPLSWCGRMGYSL